MVRKPEKRAENYELVSELESVIQSVFHTTLAFKRNMLLYLVSV